MTTCGMAVEDGDSWFFIVGCQRSGTTLMRLILQAHPEIECVDEPTSYRVAVGKRYVRRCKPLLGLKTPCLTDQFLRSIVWDPRLLPDSPNPYDGQRLIFMVRDVRDVVASMCALRVEQHSWVSTYLQAAIAGKLQRDVAFRSLYGRAIAAATSPVPNVPVMAAVYWRYKMDSLQDYVSHELPLLVVRYEDLVSRPQVELLRVCRFLGIEWSDALLDHTKVSHADADERGQTVGGTAVDRRIDRDSVGRWRQALPVDVASEVAAAAGPPFVRMYGSARRRCQ